MFQTTLNAEILYKQLDIKFLYALILSCSNLFENGIIYFIVTFLNAGDIDIWWNSPIKKIKLRP